MDLKECKLCDVPFTSPLNVKQHYVGQKHRKNLRRVELLGKEGLFNFRAPDDAEISVNLDEKFEVFDSDRPFQLKIGENEPHEAPKDPVRNNNNDPIDMREVCREDWREELEEWLGEEGCEVIKSNGKAMKEKDMAKYVLTKVESDTLKNEIYEKISSSKLNALAIYQEQGDNMVTDTNELQI